MANLVVDSLRLADKADMNHFFGFFRSNRHKRGAKPLRRRLGVESLETRELLSVSFADLPQPEYSAPIVADFTASFAATASAKTKLAAPKKVSKDIDVTLTTLTIRWAPPNSAAEITNYQITIQDSKTKTEVGTGMVDADGPLTYTFEGLNPGTKYNIQITSLGDPDTTDSSRALSRSATTAKFSAASIKANKPGATSTDVVITDKDKVLPFIDSKTVKTYIIQYAPKAASINWDTASSIEVSAGTTVANASKGTINATINGLQPGTAYTIRITAIYEEGGETMTATSRDGSFKTATLPAPTLSKAAFTLIGNEFALLATVKQSKPEFFHTGTITYSLHFSTSTAKTGPLPDAIEIGSEKSGTAATFTMPPVTLKSIAEELGDTPSGQPVLLGLTSINFQVVATYTSGGVTVQIFSKALKVSLPKWYVPR